MFKYLIITHNLTNASAISWPSALILRSLILTSKWNKQSQRVISWYLNLYPFNCTLSKKVFEVTYKEAEQAKNSKWKIWGSNGGQWAYIFLVCNRWAEYAFSNWIHWGSNDWLQFHKPSPFWFTIWFFCWQTFYCSKTDLKTWTFSNLLSTFSANFFGLSPGSWKPWLINIRGKAQNWLSVGWIGDLYSPVMLLTFCYQNSKETESEMSKSSGLLIESILLLPLGHLVMLSLQSSLLIALSVV